MVPMRAFRMPATIPALSALLLLSGCLGTGATADIADSELEKREWRQTGGEKQAVAGGVLRLYKAEYHPQRVLTSALGGVVIVTSPDVPILDESRFIGPALANIEESEGIHLEAVAGPGFKEAATVAGGAKAEAWNYDIEAAGAPAKAQVLHWNCVGSGDFVVAAAYGLAGGTFDDAKQLARLVVC